MTRKHKPAAVRRGWALVTPRGVLIADSVRGTMKDSIGSECWAFWGKTINETWASHLKQGWRVVRVTIQEAK